MTRTAITLASVGWAASALLAPGCGGTSILDESACDRGSEQECTCADGESGVQRCNDETRHWDQCDCGATGSGGSTGSCADGTVGCPCYGNDTCNDDLGCVAGTCVVLGSGGGSAAGGSASALGGSAGVGGFIPIPLGGSPSVGGGGFSPPPCVGMAGLPQTCDFEAREMEPDPTAIPKSSAT